MGTLWQDLRYGLRMLAKSPGFAMVAILTLALGIGANTAIFSAVNGILLKPLPYADAAQLVGITSLKVAGNAGLSTGVATATARDVERQCPAIEQLAASDNTFYTLTGQAAPEKLVGAKVPGNFFTLLGVRPLLGRPILSSDTMAGNSDVVVLSYAAWKELFGGDQGWIGRKITLDGKQYTVIGVMPPQFDLGIRGRGVWMPRVPVPDDATDRESRMEDVVARLKPGATVAEVQTQLNTLSARLAAAYPKTDAGWKLNAAGVKESEVGSVAEELLLLLGAVGFVLLIACVNVSGLLLARGWARQKEVAIREALGASRLRIIRQFLAESVLLALAGGALGLLFSVWGIHLLCATAPPDTPRVNEVSLNAVVLWFTLGLSLVTAILFGLAPAMQASARRIGSALKESLGRSAGGFSGYRSRTLRSVLVVVEVALAVILVVGATLVARSFEKLSNVDLGFRTDHLLTMTVNFSKAVCDEDNKNSATQCQLADNNVLARVKALSAVESVAEVSNVPLAGVSPAMNLSVGGQSQELGFSNGAPVLYRIVTPEFFRALGIRFLKGRAFAGDDAEGAEHVAIVNETFAKKYLSGNPLGKRISLNKDKTGQPEWMDVVGEVGDTQDFSLGGYTFPEFYVPLAQTSAPSQSNLIVRTAGNPMAMAAAVKREVWSVDKDAPVTHLRTMDQILSNEVAEPRFQMLLLGAFGALGLVLAMVGIYGVISYGVTQRTHEIGVRIALGAQPGNVLRMVVREGMLLAVAGVAIGIGGALALGRVLQSLLFEVKPSDPVTFVGVAMVLPMVALAACYVPARRAMRIEPMEALRHE